jgi:hypothetical protein
MLWEIWGVFPSHIFSANWKVGTILNMAIQCCGSGSGIRCFFTTRIRDPDTGWIFRIPYSAPFLVKFSFIIFRILVMLSLYNSCTLKSYSWNHKQQDKVCLVLPPPFYIGLRIRGPGSGLNKFSDPDPGSGIKHPGSATLANTVE